MTLLALLLLSVGTTANEINCNLLLRETAEQGLKRKLTCESCNIELQNALHNGPEQIALLANWISHESLSFDLLLEIQNKANQHGVEVLTDLSSQYTYQHPSWNRVGILVNFVFRGNKSQLVEFFKALKVERMTLVHFEILNFLHQKTITDFVSMHSGSLDERERTVAKGLVKASQNLVVIDDLDSKFFFALVDPETFQNFLSHNPLTQNFVQIDFSDLLTHWNDKIERVRDGQVKFLIRDQLGNAAYLINLDDFAEIQTFRKIQREINSPLIQRLGLNRRPVESPTISAVPIASPNLVKGVGRHLESNGDPATHDSHTEVDHARASPVTSSSRIKGIFSREIVSVSMFDSVLHRRVLFGPSGKARLSPMRPAIQLTFHGRPRYVVFYPAWARIAPIEEVFAEYMHVASMTENQEIPAEIARYIEEYRKSLLAYSPQGFVSYSMTDVNASTTRQVFGTDKPMVFSPGRGDKSAEPLSFVLFPIKFGEDFEMPKQAGITPGVGGLTEVFSIPSTDFLMRRRKLFESGGQYELGMSRPAVQLTRKYKPTFIVVHPGWLKTHPLKEISSTYLKFAQMDSRIGVPQKILKFLKEYRRSSMYEIAQKYPSFSLSKLNTPKGSQILDQNLEAPLILTSLERERKKSIEYVLLPVFETDSPRPQIEVTQNKLAGNEYVVTNQTAEIERTPNENPQPNP